MADGSDMEMVNEVDSPLFIFGDSSASLST